MCIRDCYYGQRKGLLDAKTRHEALAALHGLPKQIEDALPAMRETAQMLSPLYASAHSFFYLGRGHAFPLALEGALKLKEISYIHAEGDVYKRQISANCETSHSNGKRGTTRIAIRRDS